MNARHPFFLAVLAGALESGFSAESLAAAWLKITETVEGSVQLPMWKAFLSVVVQASANRHAAEAVALGLQLAELTPDEPGSVALAEAIRSDYPELAAHFVEPVPREALAPCRLQLETPSGTTAAAWQNQLGCRFYHLTPGNFRLSLDSGLLLWAGPLAPQHVLLTRGGRAESLPAAAASESLGFPPRVQVSLLAGQLTMAVFAGFESGTMAIVPAESAGRHHGGR